LSVRAGLIYVMAVTVAIGGCGGEDDDGKAKPSREAAQSGSDDYENPPFTARVEITKNGYRPKHVRILVGGRVTFVNMDKEDGHTAETEDLPEGPSDNNEFDTHTLTWEEPYTITFHKPEKVTYFDSFDTRTRGTVEAVPKYDTQE
jgi:plastocyanin